MSKVLACALSLAAACAVRTADEPRLPDARQPVDARTPPDAPSADARAWDARPGDAAPLAPVDANACDRVVSLVRPVETTTQLLRVDGAVLEAQDRLGYSLDLRVGPRGLGVAFEDEIDEGEQVVITWDDTTTRVEFTVSVTNDGDSDGVRLVLVSPEAGDFELLVSPSGVASAELGTATSRAYVRAAMGDRFRMLGFTYSGCQ